MKNWHTCKRFKFCASAFWSVLIWVETTDNTDTSILLNSSKQPHAPHCARPENILPIDYKIKQIKEHIFQYVHSIHRGEKTYKLFTC